MNIVECGPIDQSLVWNYYPQLVLHMGACLNFILKRPNLAQERTSDLALY